MGLHKPFDRHFVLINGNVMTSGRSLGLAKGQLGLFDLQNETHNGQAAVSTLAGASKSNKYQFKLGAADLAVNRSQTNKNSFTFPFSVDDVLDVKVSAPASAVQSVDEVVVGYNGIDDATSISFAKGDRKEIFIRLSGEKIGMLGYPNNFVDISYVMEEEPCNPLDSDCTSCDNCDAVSCTPIILRAVEFLNSFQLRGGVKVEEMVEITPVKSCGTSPTYVETDYSFYTLTVNDLGDETALAMVRAQYPDYTITRKSRSGTNSVYEFMTTSGATITDYSQGIASILKGCEVCPSGYTATTGGYLYSISVDDDGVDISTDVDALTGYVAGTVMKHGNDNGVGYYTLVTSAEISTANLSTYVGLTPTKSAHVTLVGPIASVCENASTTDTAWVEGEVCKASVNTYKIVLPDTECGVNRLAELQAAYPTLTIALSTGTTGLKTQLITITGTSGTATLTIDSIDYTVTFNTSLAITAQAFVQTFKDQVFAETGARLQYIAGTATFYIIAPDADIDTAGFVTRTNGANLSLTEGATAAYTTIDGGCNTEYTTTVVTNIVCPECDPIYADTYRSTAPAKYDIYEWTLVEPTPAYSTDCLCGIRFKGKKLEVHPDDVLRDHLGFSDSSVQIEVSGGYITEVREAIGVIADSTFHINYLSRWKPRTHLGGNLYQFEDQGNVFFTGETRNEDMVYRLLKGQESNLRSDLQYVDYAITIGRSTYSQGMAGKNYETNTYHFLAEVGRHDALESLVNLVAGAAGLPGVKAYATV